MTTPAQEPSAAYLTIDARATQRTLRNIAARIQGATFQLGYKLSPISVPIADARIFFRALETLDNAMKELDKFALALAPLEDDGDDDGDDGDHDDNGSY